LFAANLFGVASRYAVAPGVSHLGCREMVFTGRPMKGYVYVSDEGMKTKKQFEYWISLCIEFNKKAKASKKK